MNPIARIIKLIVYILCGFNKTRYLSACSKIQRLLVRGGFYETSQLAFLKTVLGPGDCAIDVGAHFGVYTDALAKIVGSKGKVFAFEPFPILAEQLRTRFRNTSQIKIYDFALSNVNKKGTLRVPLLMGMVPELALTTCAEISRPHEKIEITERRLDDFLEQIPVVKFIKVDIEGYEPKFFEGALNLLKRDRPFIQFEDNNLTERLSHYKRLAQEIGYNLCFLNADGELRQILGETVQDYNFYLIPNENSVIDKAVGYG